LAAEIRKQVGIESELVRGAGGIFNVSADNHLLFSKKQEGRFPTEAEILEKIRARQSESD
jgi:selT/selW/selH-like putative selenoprotein